MGIADTMKALKVQAQRFEAKYQETRAAHAALGPYATVNALCEALRVPLKVANAERAAIAVALVAEQQRKAHPLCQALLVYAFEPMLRRLAARTIGEERGDVEQRVLVAFLDAVNATLGVQRDPARAAMYLRQETEHAVFRTLRREHALDAKLGYDENRDFDPNSIFLDEMVDTVAIREIERVIAEERNAAELAEVMSATIADGGSLEEYVATKHPALAASEQSRIYSRLQQQRHRVVKRVRARLAA